MALRATDRMSSTPVPLTMKRFPMFNGRLKYRIDTIGSFRYGVVMLDGADIAEEQVLDSDRKHMLESLSKTVENVLTKQLMFEGTPINA
jgi:hypothetical protein